MKFRAKRFLAAALALTLIIPQGLAAVAAEPDFRGHWAQVYIETALENKVVQGYPGGEVRPEGLVTRAEFVQMVSNVFSANFPKSSYSELSNWCLKYA